MKPETLEIVELIRYWLSQSDLGKIFMLNDSGDVVLIRGQRRGIVAPHYYVLNTEVVKCCDKKTPFRQDIADPNFFDLFEKALRQAYQEYSYAVTVKENNATRNQGLSDAV